MADMVFLKTGLTNVMRVWRFMIQLRSARGRGSCLRKVPSRRLADVQVALQGGVAKVGRYHRADRPRGRRRLLRSPLLPAFNPLFGRGHFLRYRYVVS